MVKLETLRCPVRSLLLATLIAFMVATHARAEQDPGVACSQAMSDQPQFAGIAKKLPLKDVRDITMPMLANRTHPTAKERVALAEWFKLHDDCAKRAEEFRRSSYSPKLFNLITAGDDRLREIGGDLYAGRITYGEANKRLVQFKNDMQAQTAEILAEQRAAQEAATARAQQEAADAQARQAEAAAAQAQAQAYAQAQAEAARQAELDRRRAIIMQMIQNNQQMIQNNRPYQLPLPPPVQGPVGGTNCTTSYIGTQAYTHCN
jgi:hypothetical protein